jgi:hypothetical protein
MNEQLLFGGKHNPIGVNLTFAKADYRELAALYGGWLKGLDWIVETNEVHLALEEIFGLLNPVSQVANKLAFLATDSEWTGVITNSGLDKPYSLGRVLGGRAHCEGLLFCVCPQGMRDVNGIQSHDFVFFSYCNYLNEITEKNSRRHVCVSYENRWEFNTYGNPMEFENLAQYNEKIKRKRLTIETLKTYASHFGIRLYDETFYKKDAVIVVSNDGEWSRKSPDRVLYV